MDAPDKRIPVNDPKGDAPKEDLTGLYDLAIPWECPSPS